MAGASGGRVLVSVLGTDALPGLLDRVTALGMEAEGFADAAAWPGCPGADDTPGVHLVVVGDSGALATAVSVVESTQDGPILIDASDTWAPEDDVPLIAPRVNLRELPSDVRRVACAHAVFGQVGEALTAIAGIAEPQRLILTTIPVIAPSTPMPAVMDLRPNLGPIDRLGGSTAMERQVVDGLPILLGIRLRISATIGDLAGAQVGLHHILNIEAAEPMASGAAVAALDRTAHTQLALGSSPLEAALASAKDGLTRVTGVREDPALDGGLCITLIGAPRLRWRTEAVTTILLHLAPGQPLP